MFDWDGTAVPDRGADAAEVRELVEQLSSLGADVAIVTGTHVGNVDGQLGARPDGPGRLYLCLNRGSEVFECDRDGVDLIDRRVPSDEENRALDRAAELTVRLLAERGLRAELVSQRLNRRKIDLILEPEWRDPPKAEIGELLTAIEARLRLAGLDGLREAVEGAERAANESGLPDPRVTSDAKHVEIGLTDKADSARWIFRELWRSGVSPGLVLLAGDEFGALGGLVGSDSVLRLPELAAATAFSVGAEPGGVPDGIVHLGGGPAAFVDVLQDQVRRRRCRELPQVPQDPGWTLRIDGFDVERERAHEALLSLADGRVGTSGSPPVAHSAAAPRVLAAGVYDGEGVETELLSGPVWTQLQGTLDDGSELTRRVDLRTGVLRQRVGRGLETVSFSSLAQPGTAALRARGGREGWWALSPPARTLERAGNSEREWMRVPATTGGITAAAGQRRGASLDRLACYVSGPDRLPEADEALAALAGAEEQGFDHLLREHRSAWAARWEDADVRIDGDDDLQLAVRFALFHLIGSVADSGEAAVGARGLTGPAYRGHVFWDADVFVLPFLAATHPPAARAMLEYRIRRLPAARGIARALGRRGARFPWESAHEGVDVTPTHARDHTGSVVPIRTGQLEEHVVADVAWAAATYVDWTGDDEFAQGPGSTLLAETARYWASRIRLDGRGKAHIYGVIGPDEYHEPVDDSAFTNVMARWNLRRAADQAVRVSEPERSEWRRLADALVDGYDAGSGVYEEFAGFFALEPLVIADVAPRRPIAADLLLGRERVVGAQVVKQADVLMLHHLVPDEVVPGSLEPNFAFYEPRTAHGSSLSPGIHASLAARAGRLKEALRDLDLAARLDLDDLTGTSAGGLHLATMGSVWQALAYGFAGLRPRGDRLTVSPRLPESWNGLELKLRFRGNRVRLRITQRGVEAETDPSIPVEVIP